MAVQDSAIPVVLSLHLFTWVLNSIAFGFLLRASLTCLNSEASKKTKQYNCCGFLSVVHALAFWCFVFYQYSSINFLFTTDFLFSRANMNCVAVTINAVTSFTLSKFTQYGFFIYRLYFVFKDSPEEEMRVEKPFLTKIVGLLALYCGVMQVLSVIMSADVTTTVRSNDGQGKYQICAREQGLPPLVGVVVVWFVVFDTTLMGTLLYQFGWRLQKLVSQDRGWKDEVLFAVAWKTLACFVVSVLTTIVVGVATLGMPGDLRWFAGPHFDLWWNALAVEITEFLTFSSDGLLEPNFELIQGAMMELTHEQSNKSIPVGADN